MGNIILPNIPTDVRGANLGKADTSAGQREYQAIGQLGGALQETGRVFDAFADKEQELIDNSAFSSAKMANMEALADVENFAAQNQDKPDAIEAYSKERLGKVKSQVDTANISREASQKLDFELAYQGKRGEIMTRGIVTDLRTRAANTKIMQSAEFAIQNGDIQGAVSEMAKSSIATDKQIAWITDKIQGNVYSSVGMEMDAMTTPEELDEFSKSIMKKGNDGIYNDYVKKVELPDGESEGIKQIIDIAGLKEPQRTHLARIARNKRDIILSDQFKNYSNYIKRASRGDSEALTDLEKVLDEQGAAGIPESYRKNALKVTEKALNEYEGEAKYKILEAAAKKDEDYREVKNRLTSYYFNPPEEFDLEDELSDIEKLDVSNQVKSKLQSDAFLYASEQQKSKVPIEGDDRINPLTPLHRLVNLLLPNKTLTQAQINSVDKGYMTMKEMVDKAGSYDDLDEDVEEMQKEFARFYKENPEASVEKIKEHEKQVLRPMLLKIRKWDLLNAIPED